MEKSTRRSFLVGLSAVSLGARLMGDSHRKPEILFVGTYTGQNGSTSKGVYSFRWDPASGNLSPLGLASVSTDPSFLAISPDRRTLYAVNEIDHYQGQKTGSVSSFSIDPLSGKLGLRSIVSSGGAGPAHVSTDHTGKAAFVANYSGGSLSSYRVLPDGSLSGPVSHFHFTGHGPAPRQEAPHIHCSTISPDNRYVLVNDLGLDRILVYRLDATTAVLTANSHPFYSANPGSGPRGLVFHPNARWVYSINELANTIDVLAWDPAAGTLTRFQQISTLPPGFTGFSTAAAIVIAADGRFLYTSNRTSDMITVFSIDRKSGQLALQQHISAGGKIPRHFSLDPSERWLVVANQESANIVVFARNPRTGELTKTNTEASVDFPVCVVFA